MKKFGNVLSWATDLEENTIQQAMVTANLPFVKGHLALMPDAHLGMGATIGSVIPTQGAIIPSAVGVDIGCGMIAVETPLVASDLPDNLSVLMPLIATAIPAGIPTKLNKSNGSHDWDGSGLNVFNTLGLPEGTILDNKQKSKAITQCGTLGSGNHFVEVCLDKRDVVWVVLHSGSRGIGNQLAQLHITEAKRLMKQYFITLDDPDLAYLVEGTPEFARYIADLQWAQRYALLNRDVMMDEALKALAIVTGREKFGFRMLELNRINCHHNYTERVGDKWITRKGAIKASVGSQGVIPGSMGTKSYIVNGLGNAASYDSASHGAGRRMSRSAARKTLDLGTFEASMAGKVWNNDRASSLLDEDPRSYKDIDVVMENQKDLVTITHTLSQVFNYKG